ncbi:unnamed protein product [marine sediment metagenome]|uniref:HD/PDEase domain-containing protein n=1 Tax=marine sediment metagenome TaxID=412755 RepID=X0SL41_9ZZZZ
MECRYLLQSQAFNKVEDIKVKNINIQDIAHSLSLQCRFNGHISRFYSVAEHSVLVMRCVTEYISLPKSALLLGALLHDGNECYVGDIARPILNWIKEQNPRGTYGVLDINWLYGHFRELVDVKFQIHLIPEEYKIIKMADNFMLDIEGKKFFEDRWNGDNISKSLYHTWHNRIQCLPPKDAKNLFLKEFRDVYKQNDS